MLDWNKQGRSSHFQHPPAQASSLTLYFNVSRPTFFLFQFTRKIPTQTIGSPVIKEPVNSSLRKITPARTPKMGVRKVKAESLLTE
jgi:hypothetical protein